MATVNANGELQLEQGDVIPRAVAKRSDDPAHIIKFIDEINPTIHDADDLAQAIEHVDQMRREWRQQQGLEPLPSLDTEEL